LVKECTVDDEGDYEVVIANTVGETSHMFETIVNTKAPEILRTLPQTSDVKLHKPATLKVEFESPTDAKVIWLANGVTLDDSIKYRITTTETDSTLEIADTIVDDTEMTYTCRVKNIAGQVETATILSLPRMNLTVCSSSPILLSAHPFLDCQVPTFLDVL